MYKTKKDKISLLNEAVKSNDGNAILAVVLFIKRTLNPELFYNIIISSQIALNQYAFYLEQLNDTKELALLHKCQKNIYEEATCLYLKPILCDYDRDFSDKNQLFVDFEKNYTSQDLKLLSSTQSYTSAKKYLDLLRIQKDILKNKSSFLRKDENKQNAMDSLFLNTLYYTLSFCIKYNREIAENESYSIENFKKQFELTNKEFSIWYIKSMAEVGMWTELERFMNQKGLFNMVKTSVVSYETIVYMLCKMKAPSDQIKKYLLLVDDVEQKKNLGLRLKLTDVVIEAFKAQKDRIGLLNYRNQFKEDTQDYVKASVAAKDDRVIVLLI